MSPQLARVVGIYDRDGVLSHHLRAQLGDGDVLEFSKGSGDGRSAEQYLADKELFLNTATDLALVVDDVEGTSVFLSALRRLVQGDINSLYVVERVDLDALLAFGAASELDQLDAATQDSRFVRTSDPSPAKVIEHLRRLWS